VRARNQCSNRTSYAVGQIVMRAGGMINAVFATTRCATLEASNLCDKSRVFKQINLSGVNGRQQVSIEV
jgi:hypothetical protein